MVSVDNRSSYHTMLPRTSTVGGEQDDFTLYPEPPQGVFTTSTSLGAMSIPADSSYMFPASMAFDQSPSYAETTNYMYGGRPSPGAFEDGDRPSPGAFEDGDLQIPPSNVSSASAPSTSSSAVGSPQSHHGQLSGVSEWTTQQGLGLNPSIVPNDFYSMSGTEYTSYAAPGMEEFTFEFTSSKPPGFVDPSLIHPEIHRAMGMPGYDGAFHPNYPASPSAVSSSPQPMARNGSRSPYLHDGFPQVPQQYSPFQPPADGRRPSVQSFPSTTYSEGNTYSGDETKEKKRCPHPDCGKTFKDLKAHMLTHQTQRPEKCPILTCEYHIKGFARKYDKNRHTLTHYKGTMVCGFCPGSGSAAEKSFNRADVFKRHLTAVHGVEQTPPNSRKKTPGASSGGKTLAGYAPDATGKCSTCSQTFSNAQDFYEHLDDCVLRIVQQEDPAEAVNARRLAEVENDTDVAQTLQRNNLTSQQQQQVGSSSATTAGGEDDDEDEDVEMDEGCGDESLDSAGAGPTSPQQKKRAAAAQAANAKSRGMTHSRGGVALHVKPKGRKNKKLKPKSWGYDKSLVTLKKRVMCAFDGPRRLAKDDMMLSTDHEVRVPLSDGKSYITDLDIATVARAGAFHGATEEEKGLWVSDDPTEAQYRLMQEHAMQQEREQERDRDIREVLDCNEVVV